jgi:hypothetical protein
MRQYERERGARAALFQEVVLTLGGAFAVRGTDDETIRQIAHPSPQP